MQWSLAIAALALLAVASVSRRLSGAPVTPAMLFVAIGLVVGPEVLGGVELESAGSVVRTLAEATLAWSCSRTPRGSTCGALRQEVDLPVRLLGVGLPLTIAARGAGRRGCSAPV